MDPHHNPMSSSFMTDLPLQLELARKLLRKTPFLSSLRKRIYNYRAEAIAKINALSMSKRGETIGIE